MANARRCGRLAVLVAVSFAIAALAAVRPALAQTATDTARNKGLAWLIANQKGDGSWRSAPGGEVAATASAVEALNRALIKSHPYAAAVSWLGNASATSVDSVARRTVALKPAGLSVAADVQRLLDWRNASRAWGAYDHFGTSFPDTALALAAIRVSATTYVDADVGAGLCGIVTAQMTGAAAVAGSWAYVPLTGSPPPSAIVSGILPTALNLLEVEATRVAKGWTSVTCGGTSYVLTTVTSNGIGWLVNQRRNADGGFGDQGTSTVFETALAYQALTTIQPAHSAIGPALDFLIARQGTNGSWNSDALQTAYVLKVIPALTTALADSDGDGIPDAIETLLGKNPNVADSRWLAFGNGNPIVATGSSVLGPAAVNNLNPSVDASPLDPGTAVGDGDLNGDAVVDAADVAIAERIALGLLTPTADHLRHGDVAPAGSPDGVIDVADVARIRRKVLGLENF